ncbi:acyltransferase family protein [Paenalcaligenes hominis]|uniref:acyltransferase family protein n=1 Tax=Paenalcaligenes hominis TaxID=643674 RepID=UPI003610425D
MPSWGVVGVDIFFVISGFLISSIIIRSLQLGQFSIWHFYERRIRRLFPVLLVVLVFSLGLGWLVLSPLELQSLAKHTVGARHLFLIFY